MERCREGSYAVNALRYVVWADCACIAVCIVSCFIGFGGCHGMAHKSLLGIRKRNMPRIALFAYGGSYLCRLGIVVNCGAWYRWYICA